MLHRSVRDRKGQALVEYALLVAGIALICAAAVSVLGYKTSGLLAAMATVIPGANQTSNGPISSGHLIEVTAFSGANATIALDVAAIATASGSYRLSQNVLDTQNPNFGGLIVDGSP